MMLRRVRYRFGSYRGGITVVQHEGEDDETVIARARQRLRKQSTLGMASESYELLAETASAEEDDE